MVAMSHPARAAAETWMGFLMDAYDDNGGVQVPVSWSLEYRTGGEWKEFQLYTTDAFGIAKDQFNMVHPDTDIKADGLRLTIVPKPESSVGILEIAIE